MADAARRIGAQLKDKLDRVIGRPVPCPTDLAFGGAGLSRLYVTTARQPVSLDALANAPWSGRLFALEVN